MKNKDIAMQKGHEKSVKRMIEIINNKTIYFVKSTREKKIIPNFLIDKNNDELDNGNLLNGLKLVGDYLEKNILKPNNLNYPAPRQDFIKILK